MKHKKKERQTVLLIAVIVLLIGTYLVATNIGIVSADMTAFGNSERMDNMQRMVGGMDDEMYEDCKNMMGSSMTGGNHARHHRRG